MGANTNLVDPIGAEELIAELRRLRDRIPDYTQLKPGEFRSMVRVAHLDPEFIDAGLTSMDSYAGSKEATGFTPEELKMTRSEVERWDLVESELLAMASGVAAANVKRRYRIGTAVLQIYGLMRTLIRKPAYADLLPWVDLMRKANKFGHKRK